MGSKKKVIVTPFTEVIMVPLSKILVPATVVDMPVDVVLLGSGTPGFPLEMVPFVWVVLLEIVVLVVPTVAEPFNNVPFVKLVKLAVNAFTETKLVAEVRMIKKIASIPNN
ncbi:MAG TPA: hypothetical protein VEU72_10020 [Nitrosopumilaceae archaeon]|nr:hypothetical protein [Nitrosopumilaceae archaeon]